MRNNSSACEVPRVTSAEGTAWESPAWQCRVAEPARPESRRDGTLPKSLIRIKRCPRFSEQRLELRLIRSFLMVLRLVLNVFTHRRLVRTADAESSVAFLPCELQPVLMEPARRVSFEDLNSFGNGHICRKRNQ